MRRKQIRRLVRNGRPQETLTDARLASGFAAYQRSRAWYRWFWAWFPLLVVAALFAASLVHPVVLGIVLALGGNALLVRRSFRRTDLVNAELLGPKGGAAAVDDAGQAAPRARKRQSTGDTASEATPV